MHKVTPNPMRVNSIVTMLRFMNPEQMAAWVSARQGVYTSEERAALNRVNAELDPAIGRAS